jgi:hypothetical protein
LRVPPLSSVELSPGEPQYILARVYYNFGPSLL